MFLPVEQPSLFINDDPFLPRLHRLWWKEWCARHLPSGWVWRFVSELQLTVPTEWEVKPWLGRKLAAKAALISTECAHPRILVEASSLFRKNLLSLNVPPNQLLANEPRSLRDIQCLAVGAGFCIQVIGSYDTVAEWTDVRLQKFGYLEDNFLSLAPYSQRPWLVLSTPGERYWLEGLKGKDWLSLYDEDLKEGLVRPSLRAQLSGAAKLPRENIFVDQWVSQPERTPSEDSVRRVRSRQLLWRLRKFQLRRETEGLDPISAMKHALKYYLFPRLKYWGRQRAKV